MTYEEMINPKTPLKKVCKELAKDRYVEIFSLYGIDVPISKDGACPKCGGVDRFRFDINKGMGFCHNKSHKPLDIINVIEKSTSDFNFSQLLENLDYNLSQERLWECTKQNNKSEMFISSHYRNQRTYNYQDERKKLLAGGYHYGQCEYLTRKKISYPYSLINSDGHAIVDYFPFDSGQCSASHIYFHPDKMKIITTEKGAKQCKSKWSVKGSSIKEGQFHVMNRPIPNSFSEVVLCEGYGTAAAVWRLLGGESSSCIVLACYSASTICNTAQVVRVNMPEMPIIIAADNDFNNSGQMAANKIIETLGFYKVGYSLPNIPNGKNKYDWADIITDNDGDLSKGIFEIYNNFKLATGSHDLIPLYYKRPEMNIAM